MYIVRSISEAVWMSNFQYTTLKTGVSTLLDGRRHGGHHDAHIMATAAIHMVYSQRSGQYLVFSSQSYMDCSTLLQLRRLLAAQCSCP